MSTVTSRHRRRTPLIRLLVRLGWQRDPELWTVPCRDLYGRRAGLLIRLSPFGITIDPTTEGPLYLTAQEVGRLWGATRDAVDTCGLLTDPDHPESPPPAAAPLDEPPAPREVVHIERTTRPTVWDLRARYQEPGT